MSTIQTKRLDQVRFYSQKGLTESKIAQTLQVSERTIRRDIAQLKKEAGVWLEGKAKSQFVYLYKSTLDIFDENIRRLEELLEQEKEPYKKMQIISQITSLARIRLEIASEIPTIKKYKCSNK